ncbi:MAG: serine acetyltransferase [Lachnospiraceae bacterium]
MEDIRSIYFTSRKNYLKCFLLREHEWYIYKFQKLLRNEEKASQYLVKSYYRWRKNTLGRKLGYTIPAGVFGENLHIWHFGNIVVNGGSRVGGGCVLHGDNCIGNDGKSHACPVIGNNVDIGVGAKLIGDIVIADDIMIGAGAIVVSSFTEPGITIGGIPARRIK